MKTEAARAAAILFGLVLSAALQDATPTVFGAKIPFLLAYACTAGFPAALAAGMFEDALGAAPFGCATLLFGGVALAMRGSSITRALAIPPIAFAHAVWLSAWGADVPLPVAAVWSALLAIPAGLLYAVAVPGARHLFGLDRPSRKEVGA